ncbi:methyltransferase domain-containing protein [Cellulomonas sp. PhB150]|uniref:methyltransferase domain-containing protein n=1 Tax=Cellulomonas sp. PhB150 TaxID=2485188 RepID=UPI000F487921|nr:methyltransferase domain-containing protein [Cellulomonas sp. PhB150]ROS23929.1 S-adenosylmethionine-dependent methyltransferase [Cellulomonas sp. PhB150]
MTAFDEHLDAWRTWQESPWGRIRYRVVAETLARTCAALGSGRLRVLDVGGGDGADSAPLAAAGHDVTVLDRSTDLLEQAASRGLATIRADLGDLGSLGLGAFDLVLCHNVVQHLPSTPLAVEALAGAVATSGAISLMAPNPTAEVLVAAIRRADLAEATALLDAPTIRTVTFEHDVRRVEADEAIAALAGAGFGAVTQYGVRCVTDYLTDDERKGDPAFYAELEALELVLCDREPYLRTARMWQVVATRI